ncbi:hypothetical protein V6N13_105190 [Hibiscus sabdariffa]
MEKVSQQAVSLFVENLPPSLHWQGLWFAFGRHGDVVDAFIARKLSKKVMLARFNVRTSYWRKTKPVPLNRSVHQVDHPIDRDNLEKLNIGGKKENQFQASVLEKGESSSPLKKGKKRVTGHVEEEDIRKLKRCLVEVGREKFLITIEDEDLFLMLEDLQWSYLKEIFVGVELWKESFKQEERVTWLEISRLPLQCWNHLTLKRIAELWGSFESLGENASKSLDCEKITVLLVTNHVNGIRDGPEKKFGDSSSESTSDNSIFPAPKDSVQVNVSVEEEALMAMCFGKEKFDVNVNGNRIDTSRLQEYELSGDVLEEPIQRDGTIQDKSLEHSKLFNKCSSIYGKVESQNAESVVKNIGSEQVKRQEFSNTKMDPSWTDVVGSLGDEGQAIGIQPACDQMTKRVLEDISNMGLVVEGVLNPISKEHILECDREDEIIEMVENERDAVEVDRANGTCDDEDHYFREGSEGACEFFPEFKDFNRKKKGKKYGDIVLSTQRIGVE